MKYSIFPSLVYIKMTCRVEFNDTFLKIRENLHFILVETKCGGNIGATARALKTCGFKKLVLVSPIDLDEPEVDWMAHRADDVLDNAQIVPTFKEAIAGMHLVVGTTMRQRHRKLPMFSPTEVSRKLQTVAIRYPAAIVFGRESSGLTNEQLMCCNLHSTIPTASDKPALNLAQAVMIYAHTFFMDRITIRDEYCCNLANQRELEEFCKHLVLAVNLTNFVPRVGMDSFVDHFRRLLGHSACERRNVRLLHKLLNIFEERIEELKLQVDDVSSKPGL